MPESLCRSFQQRGVSMRGCALLALKAFSGGSFTGIGWESFRIQCAGSQSVMYNCVMPQFLCYVLSCFLNPTPLHDHLDIREHL
jgi:hypothetical protein